jgi:hypothetical protein
MKTIALVGKCARHWKMAPFDNPAVTIWGIQQWLHIERLPRADAIFEVHAKRAVWERVECPGYPPYLSWLQQPHVFPIYMRHKYAEFPASVKYPLKEVCDAYFQNLYHGKDKVGRFFTSTIAYMFALALYQGFERIEMYGVEMQVEQYQYQRDSIFWWMGFANGLGVEVVVPENSDLFLNNLYGED